MDRRTPLRLLVATCATVLAACGGPARRAPDVPSLAGGNRLAYFHHDIQLHELPGGMVVALVADQRTNLATIDLRYDVGAASDPPGRSGLAHLVEHVMFEVRPVPGQPTIGDQIDDVALDSNASTTWDATHYTATVPAAQLVHVLELEGQRARATCDQIDDAVFARERDIVLAEDAQRSSPEHGLMMQVQATIYGSAHPYARPIGSREVASATKAEVCAFVAAHYVPSAVRLVVTGPFDVQETLTLIARTFEAPPRPAPPHPPVPAPTLAGQTTRITAAIERPTALVVFAYPPWGESGALPRSAARELLEQELALADRAQPWIADTAVFLLGGPRRRVMVAAVEVESADRLDAAADEVFRRVTALRGRGPEAAHLQAMLAGDSVAAWDDLLGRGRWIADFLQYADHSDFMLEDLRRADDEWERNERAVLDDLLPEHSHVILAVPRAGVAGTSPRALPLGTHDLVPWRRAIDPDEADRPLPVADARPWVAVQRYQLRNGLAVMLAPDPKSPIVDARLVFPVGSAHQAPGQPQVAQAAAYLLGDPDLSLHAPKTRNLYRWWSTGGARQDVDVGEVTTTFSVRGLSWWSDWHLWAPWVRIDRGVYRDAALSIVRSAAEEMSSTAEEADDDDAADRRFRERLFGEGHPYATPPSAWVRGFQGIDRHQLEAWRRAHFRPRDATLVVSGAFDPVEMRGEIDVLYGGLADVAPAPLPPVPAAHPPPGPHWLGVDQPDAVQVSVTLGFAAGSDQARDRAARMVLVEMVTDRVREVREGQGASYGVAARYVGGVAGSALVIRGAVHEERARAVVPDLLATITSLRDDARVRRTAFVAARRRVVGRLQGQVAGATATADRLTAAVARGDDPVATSWPRAVADLTVADLERVMALDLDRGRMVLDLRGPPAALDATFAALAVTAERTPASDEDEPDEPAEEPVDVTATTTVVPRVPRVAEEQLSVGKGDRPAMYRGSRRLSLDEFLRASGHGARADQIRNRRWLRVGLGVGGTALIVGGVVYAVGTGCGGHREEFLACKDGQGVRRVAAGATVLAGGVAWYFAKELEHRRPDGDELRQMADDARFRYRGAARPARPSTTVTVTASATSVGLGVVGSF